MCIGNSIGNILRSMSQGVAWLPTGLSMNNVSVTVSVTGCAGGYTLGQMDIAKEGP